MPGLGFAIDWGGILSNTVNAVGAVSVARNTLRLQQAQQAAALRAQEAELQVMMRRHAETIAQPVGPAVMRMPVARESIPSWAVPAGVGLLTLVFLMRK